MKRCTKRLITLLLLAAILTLTSCSGTSYQESVSEIQTIDFSDSYDLMSMTVDQKMEAYMLLTKKIYMFIIVKQKNGILL